MPFLGLNSTIEEYLKALEQDQMDVANASHVDPNSAEEGKVNPNENNPLVKNYRNKAAIANTVKNNPENTSWFGSVMAAMAQPTGAFSNIDVNTPIDPRSSFVSQKLGTKPWETFNPLTGVIPIDDKIHPPISLPSGSEVAYGAGEGVKARTGGLAVNAVDFKHQVAEQDRYLREYGDGVLAKNNLIKDRKDLERRVVWDGEKYEDVIQDYPLLYKGPDQFNPDKGFFGNFMPSLRAGAKQAQENQQSITGQPGMSWGNVKAELAGGNFEPITKYIAANLPSAMVDGLLLAGGAVTAIPYLAARIEEIAKNRTIRDNPGMTEAGVSDVTPDAIGAAIPIAVAVLLAEKTGSRAMFATGKPGLSGAGQRIGQAIGTEGLTEGIQEPFETFATAAGTKTPATSEEVVDSFQQGVLLGMAGGGSVSTANELARALTNKMSAPPSSAPGGMPNLPMLPQGPVQRVAPSATGEPIDPAKRDTIRKLWDITQAAAVTRPSDLIPDLTPGAAVETAAAAIPTGPIKLDYSNIPVSTNYVFDSGGKRVVAMTPHFSDIEQNPYIQLGDEEGASDNLPNNYGGPDGQNNFIDLREYLEPGKEISQRDVDRAVASAVRDKLIENDNFELVDVERYYDEMGNNADYPQDAEIENHETQNDPEGIFNEVIMGGPESLTPKVMEPFDRRLQRQQNLKAIGERWQTPLKQDRSDPSQWQGSPSSAIESKLNREIEAERPTSFVYDEENFDIKPSGSPNAIADMIEKIAREKVDIALQEIDRSVNKEISEIKEVSMIKKIADEIPSIPELQRQLEKSVEELIDLESHKVPDWETDGEYTEQNLLSDIRVAHDTIKEIKKEIAIKEKAPLDAEPKVVEEDTPTVAKSLSNYYKGINATKDVDGKFIKREVIDPKTGRKIEFIGKEHLPGVDYDNVIDTVLPLIRGRTHKVGKDKDGNDVLAKVQVSFVYIPDTRTSPSIKLFIADELLKQSAGNYGVAMEAGKTTLHRIVINLANYTSVGVQEHIKDDARRLGITVKELKESIYKVGNTDLEFAIMSTLLHEFTHTNHNALERTIFGKSSMDFDDHKMSKARNKLYLALRPELERFFKEDGPDAFLRFQFDTLFPEAGKLWEEEKAGLESVPPRGRPGQTNLLVLKKLDELFYDASQTAVTPETLRKSSRANYFILTELLAYQSTTKLKENWIAKVKRFLKMILRKMGINANKSDLDAFLDNIHSGDKVNKKLYEYRRLSGEDFPYTKEEKNLEGAITEKVKARRAASGDKAILLPNKMDKALKIAKNNDLPWYIVDDLKNSIQMEQRVMPFDLMASIIKEHVSIRYGTRKNIISKIIQIASEDTDYNELVSLVETIDLLMNIDVNEYDGREDIAIGDTVFELGSEIAAILDIEGDVQTEPDRDDDGDIVWNKGESTSQIPELNELNEDLKSAKARLKSLEAGIPPEGFEDDYTAKEIAEDIKIEKVNIKTIEEEIGLKKEEPLEGKARVIEEDVSEGDYLAEWAKPKKKKGKKTEEESFEDAVNNQTGVDPDNEQQYNETGAAYTSPSSQEQTEADDAAQQEYTDSDETSRPKARERTTLRSLWGFLYSQAAQTVRRHSGASKTAGVVADTVLRAPHHKLREKETKSGRDYVQKKSMALGEFRFEIQQHIDALTNRGGVISRKVNKQLTDFFSNGTIPETGSVATAAEGLKTVVERIYAWSDRVGKTHTEDFSLRPLDGGVFPRVFDVDKVASPEGRRTLMALLDGIGIVDDAANEKYDATDAYNIILSSGGFVSGDFTTKARNADTDSNMKDQKEFFEKMEREVSREQLGDLLLNDYQAIIPRFIDKAIEKTVYAEMFGQRNEHLNDLKRKIRKEVSAHNRKSAGTTLIDVEGIITDIDELMDIINHRYKVNTIPTRGRKVLQSAMNATTMASLTLVSLASMPEFLTATALGTKNPAKLATNVLGASMFASLRGLNGIHKLLTGKAMKGYFNPKTNIGKRAALLRQLGLYDLSNLGEAAAQRFVGPSFIKAGVGSTGNSFPIKALYNLYGLGNLEKGRFRARQVRAMLNMDVYFEVTALTTMTQMQQLMALTNLNQNIVADAKALSKASKGKGLKLKSTVAQIKSNLKSLGLSNSEIKELIRWYDAGHRQIHDVPSEFRLDLAGPAHRFVQGVVTLPSEGSLPKIFRDPRFAPFLLFKSFITTFGNTFVNTIAQRVRFAEGKGVSKKYQQSKQLAGMFGTAAAMYGAVQFAQAIAYLIKYGEDEDPWEDKLPGWATFIQDFERTGLSGPLGSVLVQAATPNYWSWQGKDPVKDILEHMVGPMYRQASNIGKAASDVAQGKELDLEGRLARAVPLTKSTPIREALGVDPYYVKDKKGKLVRKRTLERRAEKKAAKIEAKKQELLSVITDDAAKRLKLSKEQIVNMDRRELDKYMRTKFGFDPDGRKSKASMINQFLKSKGAGQDSFLKSEESKEYKRKYEALNKVREIAKERYKGMTADERRKEYLATYKMSKRQFDEYVELEFGIMLDGRKSRNNMNRDFLKHTKEFLKD